MRDPYYVELTLMDNGALRMRVMDREKEEAAAEREIAIPREGTIPPEQWIAKGLAAREELVAWARSWVRRHGPKQAVAP